MNRMANSSSPIDIGIVDSHHHFWDIAEMVYPWMPPGESIIRRNYLPSDLAPNLEAAGVTRTVVIQANQTQDEAKFLLDLADATDFVAGVVVWADLQAPDIGHVLDDLLRREKLVGVRHQVEDDPDDDWLVRGSSIRGLKMLAERGLTYDVLVKPRHLSRVPVLADKVPNLRMVIDHIAKPPIADDIIEPWATDIALVAEIPGIHCKISGMVTEADHATWTTDHLKPYVSHVVKSFGFERIMFGSDWPVCLLAASYQQAMEAAMETVGPMSDAQRVDFLAGNASRFYRLPA
jgi:L-fuconolactonase